MDEAEIHLGSLCIPQTTCLTLSDIPGSRFAGPAQLGLISKCDFMSWHLSPDHPEVQGWASAVTAASVEVSVCFLLRPCRWFWTFGHPEKSRKRTQCHSSMIPRFFWWIRHLFNGQHNSWVLLQFHKLQYFPQLAIEEHLHSPVFCLLKAGSQASKYLFLQKVSFSM